MTTRLVHLEGNPDDWVIDRIATGSHDWSVLVVSTRRPAGQLLDMLEKAGADLDHLFIFDTVAEFAPSHRQGNVYAGFTPERIEALAARANRIARSEGERNVLLVMDCLDTLALVMPPAAMAELAGRVVHQMKLPSNQFDWVHVSLEREYLDALAPFVDESIDG